MPYTTIYVDDGKGLHRRGVGVVTGLDLITSSLQLGLDEENTRKIRYGLVDFTETTDLRVTPADIRRLVEMNRKTAVMTPGALVAIVAPTELPYAMARLWHTISDDLGWKANIFHTKPDALAWLRKQMLAKGVSLEDYPFLQSRS